MVSIDKLFSQRKSLCAAAEFAWNLYKLRLSSKFDNVALSPFLVEHSLALFLAGACGDTAVEITRAMGLDGFTVEGVYDWASWAGDEICKDGYNDMNLYSGATFKRDDRKPLKQQFRQYAEHFRRKRGFICRPNLVRTERVSNILVWRSTCCQIGNQFAPGAFDETTSVVVNSAICIRPIWVAENYRANRVNQKHPFWQLDDGNLLEIPAFTRLAVPEYFEDEDCRVIGLELEATNHAIYFVRPSYDDVVGLAALQKLKQRFDGVRFLRIIESFAGQRAQRHRREEMMVELPNFVTNENISSEDSLRSMGIETAFDPNRCDLGNPADDSTGVHLSLVRQSVKFSYQGDHFDWAVLQTETVLEATDY